MKEQPMNFEKRIVIVYYDMKMLMTHFNDSKIIGEMIQRMFKESQLEKADEVRIIIK